MAARHGRPAPEVAGAGRRCGDYPARRAEAVEEQWQGLSRRARRGISPADLAVAYDQTHLLICDLCTITTPRESPYGFREPGEECWTCGRGHLTDYSHRDTIPTLTDRLHTLRALLASNHPHDAS